MYTIRLTKQPQRFLKKAHPEIHHRCIDKLKELSTNPFPKDVKRVMRKTEKIFRVRVGDHRMQYEVIQEKKTIVITSIDKRPRAY